VQSRGPKRQALAVQAFEEESFAFGIRSFARQRGQHHAACGLKHFHAHAETFRAGFCHQWGRTLAATSGGVSVMVSIPATGYAAPTPCFSAQYILRRRRGPPGKTSVSHAMRAAVAEVKAELGPGQVLEPIRRHPVIAGVFLRGVVFEPFPAADQHIAALVAGVAC
jgi:hypothetical protein